MPVRSTTFQLGACVSRCIGALLLALAIAAPLPAAELQVVKISALADGTLLLNGEPSNLGKISGALAKLPQDQGMIWYYREGAPTQPPHANANTLLQIIKQYQLPMSVSSKPDFSDYIDRDGKSQPRTPTP